MRWVVDEVFCWNCVLVYACRWVVEHEQDMFVLLRCRDVTWVSVRGDSGKGMWFSKYGFAQPMTATRNASVQSLHLTFPTRHWRGASGVARGTMRGSLWGSWLVPDWKPRATAFRIGRCEWLLGL
jgi:hypothetical protein